MVTSLTMAPYTHPQEHHVCCPSLNQNTHGHSSHHGISRQIICQGSHRQPVILILGCLILQLVAPH